MQVGAVLLLLEAFCILAIGIKKILFKGMCRLGCRHLPQCNLLLGDLDSGFAAHFGINAVLEVCTRKPFQFFVKYNPQKIEGPSPIPDRVGRDTMLFSLMIATTLFTRGVNNWNEALVLFASPPLAVANYTYHLFKETPFNYTQFAESLANYTQFADTLYNYADMDTIFQRAFLSKEMMEEARNYSREWLPAAYGLVDSAREIPRKVYETFAPVPSPQLYTRQIDYGMLYLMTYLSVLAFAIGAIWFFNPGKQMRATLHGDYDDDNIVARKRYRRYSQGQGPRMLLRSMTSDDDEFYKLD